VLQWRDGEPFDAGADCQQIEDQPRLVLHLTQQWETRSPMVSTTAPMAPLCHHTHRIVEIKCNVQ
jgi:hypothetical protein